MAVAAILTKQNMADVFVFMAALVPMGLLLRSISFQTAARHSGAFVAGMIGFGAVVAAWTLAHGTSLGSVYYAMYPFRLDAGELTKISWDRMQVMGIAALLSGLLLLTVSVAISGVRRRNRDAYVVALLAVLAYDLFSVAAGTNYWLHYLIQPAVPVAALTGIVVARGSWARVLSVGAVVAAVVGWGVLVLSPPRPPRSSWAKRLPMCRPPTTRSSRCGGTPMSVMPPGCPRRTRTCGRSPPGSSTRATPS